MLYLEDLMMMKCRAEGCDHTVHDMEMFLHSNCHLGEPVLVKFNGRKKSLEIKCSICNEFIIEIAVASNGTLNGNNWNARRKKEQKGMA